MLGSGWTESNPAASNVRNRPAGEPADAGTAAALRAALAGAHDLVALIDPAGVIRFIDGPVEQLLGKAPDELIGTSGLALLHPEEREEAFQRMGWRDDEMRNETRVVRIALPDDSWREMELLGLERLDSVGGFVVGLRALAHRRVSDRVLAADDVLFRRLATISSDLMVLVDESGHVLYVSPSVTSVLGYSIAEAKSLELLDLVAPADQAQAQRAIEEAMAKPGIPQRLELRAQTFDGGARWVESTIVNLTQDPLVGSLVLHARDVHQRHLAEEELRFRAMHDPVTGLPNRYSFVEHMGQPVEPVDDERGARVHTALIFCDLDGFKQVNDRFGHSAGDEVLRVAGRRLRLAVRPDDLVARIGGDEFCVVCRGLANVHDAMEIAERIRVAVSEPIERKDRETMSVGVSIGIAWSSESEIDGDVLLSIADKAMYAAKTSGRNRVQLVSVP